MFTDKQKHFIGHTTPITCFDVSSDGLFIASCQDGSTTSHICPKEKGKLKVWDYATGKCIFT